MQLNDFISIISVSSSLFSLLSWVYIVRAFSTAIDLTSFIASKLRVVRDCREADDRVSEKRSEIDLDGSIMFWEKLSETFSLKDFDDSSKLNVCSLKVERLSLAMRSKALDLRDETLEIVLEK